MVLVCDVAVRSKAEGAAVHTSGCVACGAGNCALGVVGLKDRNIAPNEWMVLAAR